MVTTLLSKSFPERPATVPVSVVLRDFGPDALHRYVTHCHDDSAGPNEGFYWGHYFADLAKATDDFAERCRRYE